jgi:large subunit ribosomal protein L18
VAITSNSKVLRDKKRSRIRKKISGTAERPRLAVFKSNIHIYAQVIDDSCGKTIASASTLEKEVAAEAPKLKKADEAKLVGQLIAKRCLAQSIDKVVFDRGGFPYHGRVKALADAAREAGLKF